VAPLANVTYAHPAFAASPKKKPIREQLSEDGKRHWDTALALYLRGLWDGARTSFSAAFDASKNPRVLFNVAVCEKNLGHFGRAIETFQRELEMGKGQLDADEQAEVVAQIQGLEAFVARVTIGVSEAGAEVYVDDVKVGDSPLSGSVTVAIGERKIRVTKAGFVDAHETRELKAGANATVAIRMSPVQKVAQVDIEVVGPTTAAIKIDGREVGVAPYKGTVAVSGEPHSFSAEAMGFVTTSQSVIVREDEPVRLTLQLAPDQSKGRLVVNASPNGATIELDGHVMGASRWDGPVTAGQHQVVVRKAGYYTWSHDVDVPKGGERAVTATLNADRNTSFVPWLVGSILVAGASATAVYLIARPKDEQPVKGTLPPFAIGTNAVRF
jgi:hypothetical protein